MKNIVGKDSPILREIATGVPPDDIASPRIRRVVSDMKAALAPHKDGVAIAAPQIGIPLRIFVVSGHIFNKEALLEDDKSKSEEEDLVFINPEITKISRDKKAVSEGCLSVRWVYGEVRRASKLTVTAYDEYGKKFTRGASGLLAQIFQHEIDHLNGILFIDKAKRVQEIRPEK